MEMTLRVVPMHPEIEQSARILLARLAG